MKDNLSGRLALALALALPGVSLAQTVTYEVTGGRPTKASETGRSGQVSSWPSSVESDDLKDAPSGTPATKAEGRKLEEPKSPRRWWQFWRWFEKDETPKNIYAR